MIKRILSALVLVGSFSTAAQAATGVLFDSDPNDPVGNGQKFSFDTSSASISYANSTNTHVAVTISNGNNNNSYTLDFVAPTGSTLDKPGAFPGAVRSAYYYNNGNTSRLPGINVTGNYNSCYNSATGWFEVREAVFTSAGKLARLALDFKQNCNGGSAALYGAVRINSDISLAVPSIKAIAGRPQAGYPRDVMALDAGDSFTRPANKLTYLWTQTAGTPVALTGANTSLATFSTPLELPGGEDLKFKLVVSSSNGQTDTSTTTVRAMSRNDPQTYIQLVSDSGDAIGQGRTFRLTPMDGDLAVRSNERNGVSATFSGDTYYTLDFGPARNASFTTGPYENAQRFAFADDNVPGMDVSGGYSGCNTITGRFDVLDILFAMSSSSSSSSSSPTPTRFGINFEQHCNGNAPALRGQFRYNFVAQNPPTADAGANATVKSGDTVVLDGTASKDDQGITGYRWTQVSGPTVSLLGADAARASFTAPTVSAAQTLVFQLVVGDTDDLAASARKTVTVNPASGGTTTGKVDAFAFAERTGVDLNTVVTSESVTISGTAGASFPVGVSGGNNSQYSVNGGNFTTEGGVVKPGDKLVVRHVSANDTGTAVTTTVTVGAYSTTFKSTTKTPPPPSTKRAPDAFDFGSLSNVEPSTAYVSQSVTPSNYDSATVVAGQGVSYSINGGPFTSQTGTIANGQSIRVLLTSSSASLGYAKSYVTIGGVKGYFLLRTRK